MKLAVFLTFFLLLSPAIVFAVEAKDIGPASIDLDLRWNIDGVVPGKKVLKTFGYPNTTFQTVSYSSNFSFTTEKDQFGNDLLVFEWLDDEPKTIQLNVSARVDYDVHWADASARDAEKYSEQTRLVLLDDSIATQAGILSQNSVSDFETLVRFTEWVHNSIVYDDSFWLKQPTSKDIFVQKKGVCNQYAHLAMALLRAKGIPSRFVAGWVFSGKEWGPHAWSEVLIGGKWIPFDPTYNEVDTLDGSHLVFAYGFDQADIKEELTRGLSMTKQQDIKLVSFEKPREFFKLSIQAPEKVGSLASEKVKVVVQNGDSKPHAVPLLLTVPSEPKELEVKIVGDSSKLLFVPENGVAETEWSVLFPKLEENFVYNFTVQVSSYGVKEKASISGEPKVQAQGRIRILLTTIESVQATSELAVIATLANAGNQDAQALASMSLGGETQSQSILLAKGETQQVRFNFKKPLSGNKGVLNIITSSYSSTHPFEIVEAPEELPKQGSLDTESIAAFGAVVLVLLAALWLFFRRKA
ncbi:MAG: transglutaminase domain-containing protein [Candidatus Norongarragalinales archaeon]